VGAAFKTAEAVEALATDWKIMQELPCGTGAKEMPLPLSLQDENYRKTRIAGNGSDAGGNLITVSHVCHGAGNVMVLSSIAAAGSSDPGKLPATTLAGSRNDLHHHVLPIEVLLPRAWQQRPAQIMLRHA